MWEPEPGWEQLPGSGPSTLGVWRAEEHGRSVVVKRFPVPSAHEPIDFTRPNNVAWWRRELEVADSGVVAHTVGLRAPSLVGVDSDAEGGTLTYEWVEQSDNPGLFLASALGRFAGNPLPKVPWLAQHQLRTRMNHVAYRGGWKLLARTPIADLADVLWRDRERHLDTLDALPKVLQHGDPVPRNLIGRLGETVIAIDWGTLGAGPLGGDAGYLALSVKESFETVLDAYIESLPPRLAEPASARTGARITAAYTALTRADWALARVAEGEGPLITKFRHPAVAPYLRALQSLYNEIEALVTG